MTSGVDSLTRWRWAAPTLLGAWAAAIAVAPSLPVKFLLVAPAVLAALAWWTLATPQRWIACFFAAALLLPPLPIALGDSGPHVSLLFAALGLLAGILWLPHWRIPHTGLNAALLVFLAVLTASLPAAALHSGASIAAGSFLRVALFAIAAYVFWFTAHGPGMVSRPFHAVRVLYWVAAASALFACIDFYYQFPAPAGYSPQFIWLDSGVYRRAQGFFYDASTLGNLCAFFLVVIAVCWSRPRAETPVPRKGLAIGGVVFITALLLSYSRSSLLNLATASGVLLWLNRRRLHPARLAAILVPSGAVAVFCAWRLFPDIVENYWLRLAGSAEYLSSATDSVLSGRISSWTTLIAWIAAHPWQALIGIGYKTLPYTQYLGAPVVGDNMYLTMLVETGIIGLAALLWFNVASLRAAGRASRSLDCRASFCGTVMLCFWSGQMVQMLSGDLLTYWRVLPLYFWVLALAVRP